LLDRVHPGTVDRGERGDDAGTRGEPLADQLAVMDRDVISEQVEHGDRGGDGLIEVLQQGEVLDLALSPRRDAVDLSGAGVEGGDQMGGAGPLVLVLDLDRSAPGAVVVGARSSRRG
jgi:hypothetical protein